MKPLPSSCSTRIVSAVSVGRDESPPAGKRGLISIASKKASDGSTARATAGACRAGVAVKACEMTSIPM